MDLPALNEQLKLKELNYLNFSVVFGDNNILIVPKKKIDEDFNVMSFRSGFSMNTVNPPKKCNSDKGLYKILNTPTTSKEPLLEIEKKDKKSCCSFLSGLFKKKP